MLEFKKSNRKLWKIQPFMHSTRLKMARFMNWSVILQNTGKRKR